MNILFLVVGLTKLDGVKGKFYFLKNRHGEASDLDDFDVDHDVDREDTLTFSKQPVRVEVSFISRIQSFLMSCAR